MAPAERKGVPVTVPVLELVDAVDNSEGRTHLRLM